nr:MAG TPA: hypothetical protein [Caudoviricetes sp.]
MQSFTENLPSEKFQYPVFFFFIELSFFIKCIINFKRFSRVLYSVDHPLYTFICTALPIFEVP